MVKSGNRDAQPSPQRRVIWVLAPLSSTKTSRVAGTPASRCGPCLLCFTTSGRDCSAACSVSFCNSSPAGSATDPSQKWGGQTLRPVPPAWRRAAARAVVLRASVRRDLRPQRWVCDSSVPRALKCWRTRRTAATQWPKLAAISQVLLPCSSSLRMPSRTATGMAFMPKLSPTRQPAILKPRSFMETL